VAQNQPKTLGTRLRDLREGQRRSLREVAAKAGINHGYLSQLERGDVAEPAPSMLHKLASAYDIPFVVLMRWAGYVESEGEDLTSNQAVALSYLGHNPSDEEVAAVKAVLDAIRSRRPNFPGIGDTLDAYLNDTQRREIRTHAMSLLRRADALGTHPTPLDQVMGVTDLVAAGEITLELDERRTLRRLFGSLVDQVLTSLRGAIHLRAREIYVQPDLHQLKRRFIVAHEIGHDLLPWQRETFAYLDNDERLHPRVSIAFEREANQAAIELLAQGDSLRKEADDSALTTELLSTLSASYQISIQATARRVVEETRSDTALSIRFRGRSGRLGPHHVYSSATFSKRFGWLGTLPQDAVVAARRAREAGGVDTFYTVDLADSFVELVTDSIDTSYAVLTLFTPKKTRRSIRRLLDVG
jgi:transcriptional regulator with XRE-family HTH domain